MIIGIYDKLPDSFDFEHIPSSFMCNSKMGNRYGLKGKSLRISFLQPSFLLPQYDRD